MHWKYASRPSRIGPVVFNHHTTRRRLSLLVGLPSSVLHGKLAMKHKGTKANCEGRVPSRRVGIEGHCMQPFFPARSLISHVPIVSSVCVQVPRDTERPSGRPEFYLARILCAEHLGIAHVMYLWNIPDDPISTFARYQSRNIFLVM